MNPTIERENRYSAHNYHPLPVVLVRGEGAYVWDDAGKRYLDMMSAYSAVSHGHAHPRLVKALADQAARLGIVSRAFHSDRLAPFLERACELTGQDKALPMNTGAEAVETAMKAARKWAYDVKGVTPGKAGIIAAEGNFHGRTIAIVGMSSDPQYRKGFGPFPPGLNLIPYADAKALEAAIEPDTAAFLVEPIQGEGGIVVPPPGYLAECEEICRRHRVLLICDEIQTGLGRTGKLLACEHEGVKPDALVLGKALGGGLLPVSLFLARREIMDVFEPGNHGSTFGGNPLAAAVGLEALNVLVEERLAERSAESGRYFKAALERLASPLVVEVRGKGLFIGIEIDPARASARVVCERLMERGLLSKETHQTVVRLAPPLAIAREQLDWAVEQIGATLAELEKPSERTTRTAGIA
ncbi:MAG: ornithine--oxo-acid transaminase [Gammaproteobacteria bacterium]